MDNIVNKPVRTSSDIVSLIYETGMLTPFHKDAYLFFDDNNVLCARDNATQFAYVKRRTGDPTPTLEEIEFCKGLKKVAEYSSRLSFMDFIIMCGGSHYSFATEKVEGPGPNGF